MDTKLSLVQFAVATLLLAHPVDVVAPTLGEATFNRLFWAWMSSAARYGWVPNTPIKGIAR